MDLHGCNSPPWADEGAMSIERERIEAVSADDEIQAFFWPWAIEAPLVSRFDPAVGSILSGLATGESGRSKEARKKPMNEV